MDLPTTGALPPLEALREQWRRASLTSAWLFADDWYHPAVDDLLEMLALGAPAEPACLDLGFARADVGCGIGEAIDDLTCLFTTLDHPTPGAAIRALTTGWVDGQALVASRMGQVDAGSGLQTLEHFIITLQQTYRSPEPSGALLFVDVGVADLSLWDRVGRSAGMGHILTSTFGTGHPIAVLGGGSYVTQTAIAGQACDDRNLAGRIERSARHLGISELLRQPTRVWHEPLPVSHAAAVTLLRGRRR